MVNVGDNTLINEQIIFAGNYQLKSAGLEELLILEDPLDTVHVNCFQESYWWPRAIDDSKMSRF